MSKIKLSVVIPAYNEAKNLKNGVLEQVNDYLKEQEYDYEVLIVDDGSVDNTTELVEAQIKGKKGFRLIKNPHGGKAVTVMTGMLQTVGEIAVFTDMDQATPLPEIEKLMPKFDKGYDIVIGSRSGRKGAPFIRQVYSSGFTLLRTLLLGLPFKDTQCGFKAFKHQAIEQVFPVLLSRRSKQTSGAAVNAGFDVEMLFLAKKKGLKTAEVPVEWHYVGSERVNIGAAIDAIKDMLMIRLRSWQTSYD